MLRSLKKLALLPILLLAVTACDPSDGGQPTPTSPEPLLGSLLGSDSEQKFTLLQDPLLPGITSALSESALIGYGGGSLGLLGHTITVPKGAVTEPTLFTLTVLPTGYVEVDLRATVTSLLGTIDVGSRGFKKLVPVSLTYSRATNVSDPSKIKVLRIHSLLGYDDYEVLPTTVNYTAKTATAKLDHFSRYTLAIPD